MSNDEERIIQESDGLYPVERNSDSQSYYEEVISNVSNIGEVKSTSSVFKCILIVTISLANVGMNLCVDNPIALQSYIMSSMDISATKYDLLITFIALPNIIMAVLSGILIDNYLNLKYAFVLFVLFNTLGQVMFALGAMYNYFWLMVLGRLLFGMCSESIQVGSNKFAAIWLEKKWLSVFYGIFTLVGKFGEFSNMYFINDIYVYFNRVYVNLNSHTLLGITLGIGVIVCVFSLLCSIILSIIHSVAVKKYGEKNNDTAKLSENGFSWKDLTSFNKKFWIICIICALSYSATTSFNSLSLSYYIEKYLISSQQASVFQSVYIASSFLVSPFFGFFIAYIGYNLFLYIFSASLSILSILILAFTFGNLYAILAIYGMSTSLRNVVLWPMVTFVVPPNKLGLAFGIVQSIQNLALSFMPIIAAKFFEQYGGLAFLIFVVTTFTGNQVLSMLLYFKDSTSEKPVLNLSEKKAAEYDAENKL